jgi:hypothetical protein
MLRLKLLSECGSGGETGPTHTHLASHVKLGSNHLLPSVDATMSVTQLHECAAVVARNANEAMVAPMVVWRSLRLVRACSHSLYAAARLTGMSSVVVNMISNSIFFIKTFYKRSISVRSARIMLQQTVL